MTKLKPCIFSQDRLYRYTLWRKWDMSADVVASQGGGHHDKTAQYLCVIGLNPSTADDTQNDPTITRCIDFAQRWGFSGLCMLNLFAYRATKPSDMKEHIEPVGWKNDSYLIRYAQEAGLVLAAWGAHGAHMNRAAYVKGLMRNAGVELHCLEINRDGSPKHPLYISADKLPTLYSAANSLDVRRIISEAIKGRERQILDYIKERNSKQERCPTCGELVYSIFDHLDKDCKHD